MSADGTGLFQDDEAFDVRALYRELVGDGKPGSEATDLVVQEWGGLLEDPHVGPVFWLALAATQWKLGRLEARVLEKALRIIDDGSDLARWAHDPAMQRKRKSVLRKLREQLSSAQSSEKRVKPLDRTICPWELGEVIAHKLKSGKFVLFRVADFMENSSGKHPVIEFLDWVGESIPSVEEIAALPVLSPKYIGQRALDRATRVFLAALKPKSPYNKRLHRLGIKLPCGDPSQPRLYFWSEFDNYLARDFGLE